MHNFCIGLEIFIKIFKFIELNEIMSQTSFYIYDQSLQTNQVQETKRNST